MVFRDIIQGIRSYRFAWKFIISNKLGYLFLIPAVLQILLFAGLGYFAWNYSGALIEWAETTLDLEVKGFWAGTVQVALFLIIRGITILLFFKWFRYVVLILFAPILAFISELVQNKLSGQTRPFKTRQFLKDIGRGAAVAINNLFRELVLTVAIFGLTISMPFLIVVTPILLFLIESYYYGFSMIDYRNEYYKLSGTESREQIWQRKGLAIGVGLVFNLLLFVPIIGVMVGPTWAVVAAGMASPPEK